MNRRNFLKLAGLGTAAVAVGSTAMRIGSWWEQGSAADLKVLSKKEATITASISDAMFPGDAGSPPMPNGVELGMVEQFDEFLANIDTGSADGLRMILHAIDDMAVFSDFGLARFHKRPRAERIAILKAWDTSGLMVRRSAFRALKYALATQYCTHPSVLKAAGIHFTCGGKA